MANDLASIRDAMADWLDEKLPSRGDGGPTVYARGRSSMNPPFLWIQPRSGLGESMGGLAKQTFIFSIFVVMSKGMEDENWESRLDEYLASDGRLSIKAALHSDKTLGGAVELLDVETWDSYGQEMPINGIGHGAARLVIRVWGKEPS